MHNTGAFFNNTASGGFFKEGSILGNVDSMTPEQLKERLVVAETLMKKLHNRNKDIELYHKQKLEANSRKPLNRSNTLGDAANNDGAQDDGGGGGSGGSEDGSPHELDIIAEFKKREEKMTQELQQLNNEITDLKLENQELIKTSNPKTDRSTEVAANSHYQKYTKFLEKRIQECMQENKRYLSKYSELR